MALIDNLQVIKPSTRLIRCQGRNADGERCNGRLTQPAISHALLELQAVALDVTGVDEELETQLGCVYEQLLCEGAGHCTEAQMERCALLARGSIEAWRKRWIPSNIMSSAEKETAAPQDDVLKQRDLDKANWKLDVAVSEMTRLRQEVEVLTRERDGACSIIESLNPKYERHRRELLRKDRKAAWKREEALRKEIEALRAECDAAATTKIKQHRKVTKQCPMRRWLPVLLWKIMSAIMTSINRNSTTEPWQARMHGREVPTKFKPGAGNGIDSQGVSGPSEPSAISEAPQPTKVSQPARKVAKETTAGVLDIKDNIKNGKRSQRPVRTPMPVVKPSRKKKHQQESVEPCQPQPVPVPRKQDLRPTAENSARRKDSRSTAGLAISRSQRSVIDQSRHAYVQDVEDEAEDYFSFRKGEYWRRAFRRREGRGRRRQSAIILKIVGGCNDGADTCWVLGAGSQWRKVDSAFRLAGAIRTRFFLCCRGWSRE